ncbi:type IV pilus secretin PilQ family protein [Marinimicrobium locisalis]|uniref:type IV pilus secretin PilQ family protein n=1 Tax=Marinimicrobium locisalis TaxID=546022 RepID=UPI003221FE45
MRNLALFLVCLAPALGWSQSLNDIQFSELPGERFEVRMAFDGEPPRPEGYTIEQPARIVMDFPDVQSSLEQRRFPLSFENSSSALVLSSQGRTRLILNLSELTTYNARVEGNQYILEVGAAQGGYVTQAAQGDERDEVVDTGSERQPRKASRPQVTDIDFRRGEEGEGRIVLQLSDDNISSDIVETGKGVDLEIQGVFLPEELRRRLDVTDFATPVTMVTAQTKGSDTVIKVAASGDYDYMAYQADNEYVISVKPLTEQEIEAREQEFNYTGEKLSLNFQDIEVRSVLQIIADFTDLNLVASDTVQGRITLRLDSVPWDQALDLVLKTKGLDKRLNGNVLMVAPAAEIAERERQELSARKQLEELAPLRTEYIRVRYANAREMFELFRGEEGSGGGGGSMAGGEGGNRTTGSVLSQRGDAIVDERTNSIIITDTADRIEAFKRLVDQIDIPIRQVMIEARLVIANTDFRREMGVRWGGVGFNRSSDALVEVAGSTSGLDSAPGSPAEWLTGNGSLDLNENHMVDLGVDNPAGSFAFSILSDSAFIDMELSALESNGDAEIVSQPKVITGDKQQATIMSGTEIPYQEASASGATTTSFKEAVLKLDVTPQITPDNRIIMDLVINQDSVGALNVGSGIPSIDVTEVMTKVLVQNGQTVVLGGIFTVEQVEGVDKVPFLGDIPGLGKLFRRDVVAQEKRELLVFITPKIMADTLTE